MLDVFHDCETPRPARMSQNVVTMWRFRKSHFAWFLIFSIVLSENIPFNGSCNSALSRVNPATHKFESDCDDNLFCNNATGTCQYKTCQIYDHSITYNPGEPMAMLCPQGSFCPDVQDYCRPQLPLGTSCELDRDGE